MKDFILLYIIAFVVLSLIALPIFLMCVCSSIGWLLLYVPIGAWLFAMNAWGSNQ